MVSSRWCVAAPVVSSPASPGRTRTLPDPTGARAPVRRTADDVSVRCLGALQVLDGQDRTRVRRLQLENRPVHGGSGMPRRRFGGTERQEIIAKFSRHLDTYIRMDDRGEDLPEAFSFNLNSRPVAFWMAKRIEEREPGDAILNVRPAVLSGVPPARGTRAGGHRCDLHRGRGSRLTADPGTLREGRDLRTAAVRFRPGARTDGGYGDLSRLRPAPSQWRAGSSHRLSASLLAERASTREASSRISERYSCSHERPRHS